jgi:hypothetical protein
MTSDLLRNTDTGTSAPRRTGLRLVDVMLLVAAAAIALYWVRAVVTAFVGFRPATPRVVAELALRLIDATLPALAVAAVALTVLGLRPPRPPLRKLALRPGWLACAVVTCLILAAVAGTANSALLATLAMSPFASGISPVRLIDRLFETQTYWGYLCGLAVAVAWIALGSLGRRHAEPNWEDRLGRAVGWGWIVLSPLATALRFVILLGLLI